MSAALQLIAEAHQEGASFHLIGDRLRLVPDTGRDLSPALVERAKALRSEVIAVLSPPPNTMANLTTPPDATDNLSTRKNREALRAGLTDRWCSCGAMASLAWPIAGDREQWRCMECAPVGGES